MEDNLLLKNRGPDDSGCESFSINENSIYLGHNRLTIQDISKNGSQPMYSYSKRFIIKTMQLVGAKKYFIQKPFLIQHFKIGLISSMFAIIALIFLFESHSKAISKRRL